jgi:hypothetical protein
MLALSCNLHALLSLTIPTLPKGVLVTISKPIGHPPFTPKGLYWQLIIMATPGGSDMGQYFDFGEAAIPDGQHETAYNSLGIQHGSG